jgi:hypothetical protein
VAKLISPVDNAKKIPTTIILKWNPSKNASVYHIEVSKDRNFTECLVDDRGIAHTVFPISGLEYSTVYYWRVKAINNAGSSEWTDAFSFTTTPSIPSTPEILFPTANSKNTPVVFRVKWRKSTNAESYSFQLSEREDFSSLLFTEKDIYNTEFNLISDLLEYNTPYFWRVCASNSGGNSGWSRIMNFKTEQQVSAEPLNRDRVSIETHKEDRGGSSDVISFCAVPSIVNEIESKMDFMCSVNSIVYAEIYVYDALANLILKKRCTLFPNSSRSKLSNICSWDLKNTNGKKIYNGTYVAVHKILDKTGREKMYKTTFGV